MTLMMLASLSGICQYPTIKKIGKDSVVMMTLNQANKINENFSLMKDSIGILNGELELANDVLIDEQFKHQITIDSLNKTNLHLITQTRDVKYYKGEVQNIKNRYNISRKEYRSNSLLMFVGAGIFMVVVAIFSK